MKKKYVKPRIQIVNVEMHDICIGSCYDINVNVQQLQQKEYRTIKVTNDEIWNRNF